MDRTRQKVKNFFDYMIQLHDLSGKVVRNYKEYEKNWFLEMFSNLDGIHLLEACRMEGAILEIYRQSPTDLVPPEPQVDIKEWIDFDMTDETSLIQMKSKREVSHPEKGRFIEHFLDHPKRRQAFHAWENRWKQWAKKVKRQKLYEEFFQLIQRFEKEGEQLELIFGKGVLLWDHPEVGVIQHPLITVPLQLDYDQNRGIIAAKLSQQEIRVEMSVFNGIPLPNMKKVNQLIESVADQEIHSNFSAFFEEFAHLIDANGKYMHQFQGAKRARPYPVIYNEGFFSLRKKRYRIIREDLNQILAGIENHQLEIPSVLRALVGEQPIHPPSHSTNSQEKIEFLSNHLFFPLAANEQQKEIVWRLQHQDGVTVQGPPGTGKTHTIANLVSHFLAQGKRILITSQKEGPLRVLKEKIPTEIRDLCVPLLGGGREAIQEIEQSIRKINEKLGTEDLDQLEFQIKTDLQDLEQSRKNEAQLKHRLKKYAEQEGSTLFYREERLLRHEVARRVAHSGVPYQWIVDEIPMEATFPFTKQELREWIQLQSHLQSTDLLLNEKHLPHIGTHIRDSSSFEKFIREGHDLKRQSIRGKSLIAKYQMEVERSKIQHLLDQVNQIISQIDLLKNPLYRPLIEEFQAGGTREEKWRHMIEQMSSTVEELLTLYYDLVSHSIQLPKKSLRRIEEDIKMAIEKMEKGKKPTSFFFFLGKGKTTKYLFETPILNQEPAENLEDLKLIQTYVHYQRKKHKLARVLNGYMVDVGFPPISADEQRFPHILEERVSELQKILKLIEQIRQLMEEVKESSDVVIDFFAADTYTTLHNDWMEIIHYLDYQEWKKKYQDEYRRIEQQACTKQAHPIWREFLTIFEAKDTNKWETYLQLLVDLYHKKDQVYRYYHLLKKIHSCLPQTAELLEQSVGNSELPLAQFEEAFECKKLQTWVDETKHVQYESIQSQIMKERQKQKKLILNIVSQLTWKKQIQQMTEEEKRALAAWKTNIKRYGKGMGKYAQTYLRDAREAMKKAQTAIPVWIMPMNQVLENFPVTNKKFDLIIFDESSQCDLFSFNVLLRGKKTIIVGDDEQISPQSIGIRLEEVQDLKKRYLQGIPNANLLDGNTSLYEIAEQIFPKEGKMMLREHFRCVPEIIQFSNNLSYGGQMIPLRLPLDHEKIEPPVIAIKVNEGYIDEKNKEVNRPEIQAIVHDIQKMVEDSTYDDQTFGVISLQGNDQAQILETEIRKAIGEKEFHQRKVICGNPYTLQGDERDIIFLSMVVAPNRRFNALDQVSYKQRFNVAASRARNQMRLYHSVDLEDLHSRDLRYRLLSYCQYPTRVPGERNHIEELFESAFERDVFQMIQARGYRVVPQVEVGGYQIDFVVEGKRDRLAVECDGKEWCGIEKFERDLQRQESLERAGWKFWRIRGREFYLDREKAMESLWTMLENMGIEPNHQPLKRH